MPAPPTVDPFDDIRLDVFYDSGTLHRGRAYASEGRVELLSFEHGAIKSVCEGSGNASYIQTIRWSWHGTAVSLDDTCSCPIGGGCKHCVAALLTARRIAERSTSPPTGPGASSEWRRVFAELATAAPDDDLAATTDTPLAVQFALHIPKANRYSNGTGPQVTVRPMRRSTTGKWVKTGAAWRDLESSYQPAYGPSFDEHQRLAIRSLMISGRISVYLNTQAVSLGQFGSGLWYQLERAVDVGVVLIGEHRGTVVEMSPTAVQTVVDLSAESHGAVTLSTTFRHADRPLSLDNSHSGLLGNPPHGLWIATEDHLHLLRLDASLHPTVAKLATTGGLTVPAGDVDELLDVYQPALARHVAVESSDHSVTITTNEFDSVVVIIERTALVTARVHWMARYRRGERTTDHPLHHFGRGRDRVGESEALASLDLPHDLLSGFVGPDGAPRDVVVSGPEIVTLFTDVIPFLEKTGITVELIGDQPALSEATDDPMIELTVADSGDDRDGALRNDWFDLDVQVSVDGQTIDFVSLFAALNRDDEALILPSGTWLRLDRPELQRLRDLINEARGLHDPSASGATRLNRFQASWWEELTGLGVVAAQSQRWSESVAQLAELAAPEPVEVPPDLEATLRPYQQEGLDWLTFLHRNRLGGVLADDMGLGKTVQVLALFLHIFQSKPDAQFLVVAPTSVVENWAREAARFAPSLAVRTIRQTEARRGTKLSDEIVDATLLVTSYSLFRLEFDDYAAHGWELLVLDEAQFVKNSQSKTYQCARRLEAATKIAVTGTPLENTLMDLWSLLSITAPGLYPDPKRFNQTYRKPIESGTAPELLATLRRRIAPLMRRRTKDAVLTELPPKIEQTIEIELSSRHARIYATQLQRQRQKVLGLVGDVQKHRFEIFRSLTLLRQLALDPGLIDEKHDGVGSAKLDRLIEDLEQVVAEGHRALVFSQFTRYLSRARTRLDAAGITYSYLDGRTRKRQEAIDRFKDGDTPVFVISLKAGGFGLNLTEADYCFVLDPWWNPATETQAVDRAHRIGQKNQVVVYRYVSTNTIEEKVMELKARKADLFDSVMDAEGALAGALTEDDIRGLLDIG